MKKYWKILLASNNKHKKQELEKIFGEDFKFYTPEDIGIENFDPEETGNSYRANAQIKADDLYEKSRKMNCRLPILADDSGLEVEALDGEPGVYSHRFPGETAHDRRVNLLKKLEEEIKRKAAFKCCLVLKTGCFEYIVERQVLGLITFEERGDNGYAYDPIFQPLGFIKTFAEMTEDEKNLVSHRGLAGTFIAEFMRKNVTGFLS
jgi:XTP/dITP diphosphohydrolase